MSKHSYRAERRHMNHLLEVLVACEPGSDHDVREHARPRLSVDMVEQEFDNYVRRLDVERKLAALDRRLDSI